MSKVRKINQLDRLSWEGILPRRKPLDGKVNGAKVYSRLHRAASSKRKGRVRARPGLNQSLLHLEAGGKTQF